MVVPWGRVLEVNQGPPSRAALFGDGSEDDRARDWWVGSLLDPAEVQDFLGGWLLRDPWAQGNFLAWKFDLQHHWDHDAWLECTPALDRIQKFTLRIDQRENPRRFWNAFTEWARFHDLTAFSLEDGRYYI